MEADVKVKDIVGQEEVSERLVFKVKALVREGKSLGRKESSGGHF